jgi:hypothetical protein
MGEADHGNVTSAPSSNATHHAITTVFFRAVNEIEFAAVDSILEGT